MLNVVWSGSHCSLSHYCPVMRVFVQFNKQFITFVRRAKNFERHIELTFNFIRANYLTFRLFRLLFLRNNLLCFSWSFLEHNIAHYNFIILWEKAGTYGKHIDQVL